MRFSLNNILISFATFVLPILLYMGGRAFVADQFVIPTWSMAPTLVPGDRVVVNKLIMGARLYTDFDFRDGGQELKSIRMRGWRSLRHNDIVVFNFPQVGGRIAFKINYVYCKRCVALPGDTLSIEDGHYRCNNYDGVLGLQAEQDRLEKTPGNARLPYDKHLRWNIKHMGPLYIPRKGDIMEMGAREGAAYHSLLEYETGKTVTVDWEADRVLLDGIPVGRHLWHHSYYFMAGDNVLDSVDSRYWGLVPEEYVIGVVTSISYSRDIETNELRKNRLLKRLQ